LKGIGADYERVLSTYMALCDAHPDAPAASLMSAIPKLFNRRFHRRKSSLWKQGNLLLQDVPCFDAMMELLIQFSPARRRALRQMNRANLERIHHRLRFGIPQKLAVTAGLLWSTGSGLLGYSLTGTDSGSTPDVFIGFSIGLMVLAPISLIMFPRPFEIVHAIEIVFSVLESTSDEAGDAEHTTQRAFYDYRPC